VGGIPSGGGVNPPTPPKKIPGYATEKHLGGWELDQQANGNMMKGGEFLDQLSKY
jgi:hypothetical protein